MIIEEDAKKVIATLSGKDFVGKSLTVAEARPQQNRQQGLNKRSSGYGDTGGHRERLEIVL